MQPDSPRAAVALAIESIESLLQSFPDDEQQFAEMTMRSIVPHLRQPLRIACESALKLEDSQNSVAAAATLPTTSAGAGSRATTSQKGKTHALHGPTETRTSTDEQGQTSEAQPTTDETQPAPAARRTTRSQAPTSSTPKPTSGDASNTSSPAISIGGGTSTGTKKRSRATFPANSVKHAQVDVAPLQPPLIGHVKEWERLARDSAKILLASPTKAGARVRSSEKSISDLPTAVVACQNVVASLARHLFGHEVLDRLASFLDLCAQHRETAGSVATGEETKPGEKGLKYYFKAQQSQYSVEVNAKTRLLYLAQFAEEYRQLERDCNEDPKSWIRRTFEERGWKKSKGRDWSSLVSDYFLDLINQHLDAGAAGAAHKTRNSLNNDLTYGRKMLPFIDVLGVGVLALLPVSYKDK